MTLITQNNKGDALSSNLNADARSNKFDEINPSTRDWREIRPLEEFKLTIAIFDEEIEGVVIAGVSELVVRRRKLLETLGRNRRKVAGELSVLG